MYKITILFLFFSACLSAVEYSYLTPADTISLNNGDVLEVLGGDSDVRGILTITLPDETEAYIESYYLGLAAGGNSSMGVANRTFVGPCTVSTTIKYVSYKLTRASELAQSSTPVNTVVIPTDANGNVEIILESSTDLVNWTAASPGEYSSATQNRFFRVRAVVTGN